MRFDKRVRFFASLLCVLGVMLWLPVVIYAPALAFNQVTGVNIHIIIPIVSIVCIFYTCVGGIKAVVWTDVTQAVVMFGSVILVMIKGTIDVGGIDVILKRNYDSGRIEAPTLTMDHTIRFSIWSVLFGSTMHWVQNICADQILMQRFLSLPNLKAARRALVLFVIGIIILYSCLIYTGMIIYAKYYKCDPLKTKLATTNDQLVPLLVMDVVGGFPGIPGLFVAAVFSAALSSLSTGLNSLSAVLLEDFVKIFKKKKMTSYQINFVMRSTVVICGIICLSLAFVVEKLGMILQLSATIAGVSNGPILGMFIIGMLMPRINGKSTLTGGIIAYVFVSYIAVKANIDMASGKLIFSTKPTSVEYCEYSHNYTNGVTVDEIELSNDANKPFYHMSFMFYTLTSTIITIFFSVVASLFFGTEIDIQNKDLKLYAPFLNRWYLNKKIYSSARTENYLELRFDKTTRLFGSVLFTIAVIIWLPIVIFVPALAFNQVTGVNIHIITPVVCIVCIFYTCVGGLKAVVWTDVIQSFVMFGSILIVIIKGTIGVGGLGEVIKRNFESGRIEAPEITFDPSVRLSVWSVFIGGTLFWTQAIACNQVMAQRFLALPSTKAAKHALCIFTVGLIFLYTCTCYNGMLIYAKYHKCDPLTTKLAKASDQLVPLLVMDVLSEYPGLPGLFVAGVFSAALSSLSTGLNSLSAIFLEDFLKPNINFQLTEKQTGLFLRTVVVVLGIISILLVFVVEKLGMVLQLSMALSSITNGPLFGIFLMGVCMPWINSKSALTGGLLSFVIMSYVCIYAQIDIATKQLVFPTKPTSIEDCHYEFDLNHTMKSPPPYIIDDSIENLDVGPAFHHMSFLWYVGLGGFLAVAGGNLATLIFGRTNPDEYDTRLMSPFLSKFFKCKECPNEMDESKEVETVLMSDVCIKDSNN